MNNNVLTIENTRKNDWINFTNIFIYKIYKLFYELTYVFLIWRDKYHFIDFVWITDNNPIFSQRATMRRVIHQSIDYLLLNILQCLNTQFETILANGFIECLQGVVIINHFTFSITDTLFLSFEQAFHTGKR